MRNRKTPYFYLGSKTALVQKKLVDLNHLIIFQEQKSCYTLIGLKPDPLLIYLLVLVQDLFPCSITCFVNFLICPQCNLILNPKAGATRPQ